MSDIGVIGDGPWARIFLEVFESLEKQVSGFRTRGIWASDLSLSKELADEYGLKVFDDWESIISNEEIDLLGICPSDSTKVIASVKALEAGKDLIVSPPPAFSLQDLEELTEKIEESRNSFGVIDFLSAAFPFQKAREFKEIKKFGRKMFTCNLSSLTTGKPERSILEDAYTVSGHMISILDDIEKIFTWSPNKDLKFHNKQNLTCIFVPEDKEKHGTWMNSYLPSLPAKSELLGTDYLANYVGTKALAFVYGATGGMFENSPVSNEPGVYGIHWKDHEWKSFTNPDFSYKDTLMLDVLRFLNNESDSGAGLNTSKMEKQLLATNALVVSMKRNGAPVSLEEAPSYIPEIVS